MSRNLYNLPGAFTQAVILAIEPVGTRATDAIKPAGAPRRDQGSTGTVPGALAKAVTITTERVGTRATNAIKPAGAPRREQGSTGTVHGA